MPTVSREFSKPATLAMSALRTEAVTFMPENLLIAFKSSSTKLGTEIAPFSSRTLFTRQAELN